MSFIGRTEAFARLHYAYPKYNHYTDLVLVDDKAVSIPVVASMHNNSVESWAATCPHGGCSRIVTAATNVDQLAAELNQHARVAHSDIGRVAVGNMPGPSDRNILGVIQVQDAGRPLRLHAQVIQGSENFELKRVTHASSLPYTVSGTPSTPTPVRGRIPRFIRKPRFLIKNEAKLNCPHGDVVCDVVDVIACRNTDGGYYARQVSVDTRKFTSRRLKHDDSHCTNMVNKLNGKHCNGCGKDFPTFHNSRSHAVGPRKHYNCSVWGTKHTTLANFLKHVQLTNMHHVRQTVVAPEHFVETD